MPAPVGHTCPDIDKVINAVSNALDEARKGRKLLGQQSEAEEYLWSVVYELDGVEQQLEKLRQSNAALRDWGEGLESENRELKNEIKNLNTKPELAHA